MSGRGIQQFPVWQNQSGQKFTSDYFLYGVGPGANGAQGTLAHTATAKTVITIQADSDFEWDYTTVYGQISGAAASPLPDNIDIPISVLISDGGSGRQLFNQQIPVTTLAGLGREPYILPQKRIFMGKSTVTFNFTNFDPVIDVLNFFLTLHGRKIFSLN
jgi:hypothetical protein